MFSIPYPSLTCVCSSSAGKSYHGVCGSVSGLGGIEGGLVSDVLKDLKRCGDPVKRGARVGIG